MKNRIIGIIISAAFVIIALAAGWIHQRSKQNEETSADISVFQWTCEDEADFRLSEIIDSVSFIPIETNNDVLIGEINKLVFHDNFLYILDSNYTTTLYIFDSQTGQFIQKIRKIGNGPGEYNTIQDFSINEKEGCIYLLCDKEKVFTYTLSGEFISEGKLPFYATAIEFFNDKFCFVCEDDDKGNLIVTDRKYNIESSHFPNKEYGDNMRILVHPFQKTKKGILYRRFLDNNIYRIDSRGEISLLYQINLGTNLLEIDNVKSFTSAELKFEMKYKRCHIKYFTENDNHSIIYFFDKNEPYISVYNKKSKKVKTSLLESVTDDLGHKKLPLLEYVSDQNDFVVILQPTEINDVIPLKENIKESISEDANPILYILHTKSDSYSIKQQ